MARVEFYPEGRNLPIIYDDRLMEICFGDYEGAECVFDIPEHPVYNFFRGPEHYVATANAEGFDALFERTDACLGMVYVCKGSIRVYMTSEEGREVTLFHISEGEC